MLSPDLRAILWKERRSLFRGRGSRMKAFLTLLTPLGFFAFFVPWSAGAHWVSGAPSVLASVALAMLAVILVIPDSFAGERERHTLATLLASRLSDRAILYGKMLFVVALAMGIVVVTLAVALVTANLTHWDEAPLLYSPRMLAVDLSLALALAVGGAAAGVMVSLRSQTVQEAQQMLSAVLFLPPTLLGPIVLVLARSKPEWGLRALLARADPELTFAVVLALMVAMDWILVGIAARRFQRSRLIQP